MSQEHSPSPSGKSRQSLPLSAVTITDEFWERRRTINREKTLENQLSKLESRIENLKRAGGLAEGDFEGPYHNDPPVYKLVEAACYELQREHDPELRAEVDEVVEVIADAQQADGYLHSNFILEYDPDERFTNLHTKHELFALGHLTEAAVAHHRATDDDILLETAKRFADLACETFGPDGRVGYPGHPETTLALVRLYRETGVQRYIDLATFFVDERGRADSRFAWELANEEEVAGGVHEGLYSDEDGEYDGRYAQDHAPVRDQETVEGHAVKATFLYAGMAGVAAEIGDDSLLDTLEDLWANMTERRMYITGGIGARRQGEAFGEDFELPNESAYAETCAAFGSIIWNQSMLELTGEGRFADLIERTLYNGFLAGISLDGTRFSYTNPLASDDHDHHRQPWYHTSCCPPNVARLLASLERYIYSQDERTLAVDQFVSSTLETEIDGTAVELSQTADLPWSGDVTITIETEIPATFELAVRIPEWADDAMLTVNGKEVETDRVDGYVRLERTWDDDDEVRLVASMEIRQVVGHPEVKEDSGRVAIMRGPLVYCFEETDNPRGPHHLSLAPDFDPTTRIQDDVLEGVRFVDGAAEIPQRDNWENTLYRDLETVKTERVKATAVPYYAWDNRDPGRMQVWVRSERTSK